MNVFGEQHYELYIGYVPRSIELNRLKEELKLKVDDDSILELIDVPTNTETGRKVVIKFKSQNALEKVFGQNGFFIIDNQCLKLLKDNPTTDESLNAFGSDWLILELKECPIDIVEKNPDVLQRFCELIENKHESSYQRNVQNDTVMIKCNQIEALNDEQWKTKLRDDLAHFVRENFKVTQIKKELMLPATWIQVIRMLIEEYVNQGTLIILCQTQYSVRFLGIDRVVDEMMGKVNEILTDENRRNVIKQHHITGLTDWQIKYLKHFDFASLNLDQSVKVNVSFDKVTCQGPNEAAEQTMKKVENFAKSLRKDRLNINADLEAYLTNDPSETCELMMLAHETGLRSNFFLSNGTISMIYAGLDEKELCKELIDKSFACEKIALTTTEMFELTQSEKFQKLIQEMNIADSDKSIQIQEKSLVLTGKKQIVENLSLLIREFFEINKVSTIDLTSCFDSGTIDYIKTVGQTNLKYLNISSQTNGKLEITGNREYCDNCLEILRELVRVKVTENFSLSSSFYTSADLSDPTSPLMQRLKTLENDAECLIIPMCRSDTVEPKLKENSTNSDKIFFTTNYSGHRCELTTVDNHFESENDLYMIFEENATGNDLESLVQDKVREYLNTCASTGERQVFIQLVSLENSEYMELACMTINSVIATLSTMYLIDLFDKITFVSPIQIEMIKNSIREIVYFSCSDNAEIKESKQTAGKVEQQKLSIQCSSIKLNVYKGNITDAQTDVIVNPTNASLEMSDQVSRDLCNADPELNNNLNVLRPSFKRVGLTHSNSASIKCKNICHLDTSKPTVKDTVMEALIFINDSGYSSATFPFIRIRGFDENANDWCREMCEAVMEFANRNPFPINRIDICLLEQEEYVKFEQVIREKQTNELTEENVPEENKENTNKPEMCLNFKISSNCKENIDKCKAIISSFFSEKTENWDFEHEFMDFSNQAMISMIERICKENLVKFEWDYKNKCVKLIGSESNLNSATNELHESIMRLIKSRSLDLETQQLAQTKCWQVKKDETWLSLNVFLSVQLEIKHMSLKYYPDETKIYLLDQDDKYFEADVKKKELIYLKEPSVTYSLQKIDLDMTNVNFPQTWRSPDSGNLALVPLEPTSLEYTEVVDFVKENSSQSLFNNVVSIQRVENRSLFVQYSKFKESLTEKYAENEINEKRLFYGNERINVDSIWRYGFNRSYSCKTSGDFGNGVYFSKLPSYNSHNEQQPKETTFRHMFVCTVLLGKFALGDESMDIPPQDADSTVDNIEEPNWFVIYKDAQAYPQYLLTYA